MEMEMATDENPTSSLIIELVTSLEQATQMAKQLPNTTDPSQLLRIYSTLQSTHTHLSSFLSPQSPSPHAPPVHTSRPPRAAAENSVSDEPMEVGDDGDAEEAVERVEERLRECFIQNKRHKRPLSPTAVAAAEQRVYDHSGGVEFDPYGNKMRALDLIYQFHG